MALLNFNKRLGWVVAACVAWSLVGMAIAAGMAPGHRTGKGLGFRLSMGLAQNSIIVDGQVLSIIESKEKLTITVRIRPDGKQSAYHPGGEVLSQLPDNLEVVFTTGGERRPGPPEISLLGGTKQARELAPKRFGLLTGSYAIKFAPGHLRLIPKPENAKPGWWRRFVQQEPGGPEGQPRPGGEMRHQPPREGQPPRKDMRQGGGPPREGAKSAPPHGEGRGARQRRPPPTGGGQKPPTPPGG